MAPSIPDRWIPYTAFGKVIEGTRFICFKVPLRKSVQVGKKEIKEIWDIMTLLKKIPMLGAVVDLTNTSRYYDPRELEAAGVLHKKLLMPGRIIPPQNKVKEFMNTVDELLGKDCEFLIGVHCTHGLNRTGYMVCRYMRDRLGIPAKDAIKKFEEARGYEIERKNYIADLLGEIPPPPDIGNNTQLKPLLDRDRMTYRSPLDDEEYDEDKNNRVYGRRNGYNTSRSGGHSSGNGYNNWESDGHGSESGYNNWGSGGHGSGSRYNNWGSGGYSSVSGGHSSVSGYNNWGSGGPSTGGSINNQSYGRYDRDGGYGKWRSDRNTSGVGDNSWQSKGNERRAKRESNSRKPYDYERHDY